MVPQPVPPSPKRCCLPSSSSAVQPDATTTAVSLPNDIIFEILSRVPVKSACRFQCVSREWCALISDPNFTAAHKCRHAEPLIAVFSFPLRPHEGAELRLMDMGVNVVRLINVDAGGGSRKFLNNLAWVTDDYSGSWVIDPSTGEILLASSRMLSPQPVSLWKGTSSRINTAYCFGRAVPSGEYKLVRLISNKNFQVLATTSDDRGLRWKTIPLPSTCFKCYRICVAIVNGVLHLLAELEMASDIIYCFDLEKEEWKKTIEGPQGVVDYKYSKRATEGVRIAELKGTLCMIHSDVKLTNIWLLVSDSQNDTWVKTYTIRRPPNITLYNYNMPLGMTDDGKKLLFQCSLPTGLLRQAVRIYDPCTNTCTDVAETPCKFFGSKISLCNLHLDSFISVKI